MENCIKKYRQFLIWAYGCVYGLLAFEDKLWKIYLKLCIDLLELTFKYVEVEDAR